MAQSQATQVQAVASTLDEHDLAADDKLSLLELTRIMDVASTLRKERSIVEQQLNADQIKAKLRERLLDGAQASGDPVTEEEVDAAIEQYYARLHEFQEPAPSWSTFLAHLWVRRGPIIAGLILLGAIAATCWGLLAAGLLPGEARDQRIAAQQAQAVDAAFQSFQQIAASIEQLSNDPTTSSELTALHASAIRAQDLGDQARLNEALTTAQRMQATLEKEYQLMIPSGPDEQTGIQREWTDERGTRSSGFYVIVEARDADGHPIILPIRNRETDRVEQVSRWAEQVPEAVFNRLAADKQADGVLDDRAYGVKRRGQRELEVLLPGSDREPLSRMGQITSWK